jgi:hypothetical protein
MWFDSASTGPTAAQRCDADFAAIRLENAGDFQENPMKITYALVSLMIATSSAPDAKAKPTQEGVSPIGLGLWSPTRMGPDGRWNIAVSGWSGVHDASAVGEVTIQVGQEADVVAGMTHKRIHPGLDGRPDRSWNLVLQKRRDGLLPIRGILHIPGNSPRNYWHFECQMVLAIDGSAIVTRQNRTVVSIRSEAGRRFRYGGQFPVAIDVNDESESPVGIDRTPELLSDPVVTLPGVGVLGGSHITLVASVGRSGRVIWIRSHPLEDVSIPADLWEQIVAQVTEFRFRPASFRGQAVTENAIVNVKLVKGK